MSDRKQVYRVENRFKEVLDLLKPDYLTIRQIGESEYILYVSDPSSETDYVLSTFRGPDEPRAFLRLGGIVPYALRLSRFKKLHFELFEDTPDL